MVGLGTYSREFGREVREAAKRYDVEPLITDDYLEVEAKVAELQPELVLGTQMERHIAKRLGVPCAVISAPVHVQDFPARYSPQMGFEGANVIFDTWVHPLMMGLEEHLLAMFRRISSSRRWRVPSHLGCGHAAGGRRASAPVAAAAAVSDIAVIWAPEAEKELRKIPFFVRGKARRNTERFAAKHGVATITIETLVRCQSALTPADDGSNARRRRDDGQSSVWRDGAGAATTLHGGFPGPVAARALRGRVGHRSTRRSTAAAPISPAATSSIATMLFLDDHFLPVLPALQARRDDCDAMVCACRPARS